MKINITMVTANKALITPFVSNLALCALSKREFRFSAGVRVLRHAETKPGVCEIMLNRINSFHFS